MHKFNKIKNCIILTVLSCAIVLTGCKSTPQKNSPKPHTKDLYAIASIPTPVLYTHDFQSVFGGNNGNKLKFDKYNEIDEIEFIALPNTVFTITDRIKNNQNLIYKVTTKEYQCSETKSCFIDARFVTTTNSTPPERKCIIPSKLEIISKLKSMNGGIYTWGGNYSQGIPQLLEFYPPKTTISKELAKQWTLTGNDCSGLIYEASNGCIPRNTSDLVNYGISLDIENKTHQEIIKTLKPLDIIVWKGHNAIVIDSQNVIEANIDFETSKQGFQGGVKIRPIKDFLNDITKIHKRIPANNYIISSKNKTPYVINRWYSENNSKPL